MKSFFKINESFQGKGQEALDFVLSMIGRLEDEKHYIVLKEVLALTNRYPSCLTANIINKLSSLEDQSSTSSLRTCIQELRNEYNNKKPEKSSLTTSGVTIVKVGGSTYGSKGELSYKSNAGGGSRHEISALRNAVSSVRNSQIAASQAQPQHPVPSLSTVDHHRKVDSRSTGRLPTHRSMTKLNNFDMTRPPSSGGLHKSMTKLTSSQQNMARSSSQMVAASTGVSSNIIASPTARSVTCITNNFSRPQTSSSGFGGGPSSLTTSSSVAAGGYISGRVTISTGPGASSPTKSMSSGSMSGIVQDQLNREVVTVNVNQINQDLMRQVGEVSNTVNPPMASNSYLQGVYNPSSNLQSRGKIAPYSSSGPLTTSPPQSLVLPSSTTPVGPILPLAPYDLKPSLSSGLSQPLSNIGNEFGVSMPKMTSSTSGPVPTRRSNQLSSTLPSPRRRQQMKEMLEKQAASKDDSTKPNQNRMSVFEPFQTRDTVQHFCEKHLNKIKNYMESLMVKLPLPVKCTIEERKGRKFAKLHFACQGRTGEHCLYKTSFYTMKTRNPRTWIHLMFLALQVSPSLIQT